MPKYKNTKAINNGDVCPELLERRGVEKITQYRTKRFELDKELPLQTIRHTWSLGDKYYKLSHQYYGKIDYWWVIAFWNQAPTEAHLTFGQIINIPMPLETVLLAFGEKI